MAIVQLFLSIVLLVYAALQTDLNRKCRPKNAVSESEASLLQYINTSMLVIASLGILFFGYQTAKPHATPVGEFFKKA